MESTGVTYLNKRLCYIGQKCHKIPEGLVNLYGAKTHALDLSYNEIVTLKGLEGFYFLRELVLDNNHLSDSLVLPFLPYLHTLSLNKNHINIIEDLINKIDDNLPALTFLSLLGNRACPNQLSDLDNDDEDYQRYRVTDEEREEAKRRGKFMKMVRPNRMNPVDDDNESNDYTPLPRAMRNPNDHRGAYTKCRYKYSGKHSEGNRFISNSDL